MNALVNESQGRALTEISSPVAGQPLSIGDGFQAQSFKHNQFSGLMDPIVLVDHFTMTASTFGEHPHAGMSAVSVLFEDSQGIFNSQDSLGNNVDLHPGDLYWLKAASGAIHDEKPTTGSRTHGLQIFVNLPRVSKQDSPDALHVANDQIPVINGDGYRVRVVLGASNGTQGAKSPALPFTILDVHLGEGGSYSHRQIGNLGTLLYAVSGTTEIEIDRATVSIAEGTAVAIQSHHGPSAVRMKSKSGAQVVLLQGAPVREPFLQQGPFVMSNAEDLKAVTQAYATGRLGSIQATAVA